MSVLSDIEAKLGIVETDIVQFFSVTLPAIEQKVVTDVEAVAQKFDNALQWMGAHGQEIATDVTGVLGVVAAAGVGIPAPVLAAAGALNTAVALVNQAVAAQQQSQAAGGTSLQQAVAAGSAAYASLKTAQSATAVAQSIVAVPKLAATAASS
jgi:hypothetical protein